MLKPFLSVLVAGTLFGCGTVVDFGPEPGTEGDEGYWHYQPELHGPGAPPRASQAAAPSAADSVAAPAAPAQPQHAPALPPPPPAPAEAPTPASEMMFNDAILRAVEAGDIDRALRLLEEAERLGSQTARSTFIEAVGRRTP
jgi:hypothetical protein